MNEKETLYSIALSRTPHLSLRTQRSLLETFGSATAVYENRHNPSAVVPKASGTLKKALYDLDRQMPRAEQELAFAEHYQIRCLCLNDAAYPRRLKECPDAPVVLFCKGAADLNAPFVISMVGTRSCTPYGKELCRSFVADLKTLCPRALIASGLAYGIDINSHRAAILNSLPTVAVLAHGLDAIYPASHRDDALKMMENGGLITEYLSGTNADKRNFIARNRIIAGISDAVVVVESGEKGGALITAEFAADYNRDVFAFPGRADDIHSIGCNRLVREHKAQLILSAQDLVDDMGWQHPLSKLDPNTTIERELFPELNAEEQKIADMLSGGQAMAVHVLAEKTGLPIYLAASLLVRMEIKGVVKSEKGEKYRLA